MGSEDLSLFMSVDVRPEQVQETLYEHVWPLLQGLGKTWSVDLEEFQIENGGKKDGMR